MLFPESSKTAGRGVYVQDFQIPVLYYSGDLFGTFSFRIVVDVIIGHASATSSLAEKKGRSSSSSAVELSYLKVFRQPAALALLN